jgi:hypothetical protein
MAKHHGQREATKETEELKTERWHIPSGEDRVNQRPKENNRKEDSFYHISPFALF